MRIEQSTKDDCIVVALIGDLEIGAAPTVQRALLNCLDEQPDSVICDLSELATIDPVCASVFSAVAHRTRSRWPDSSLLLCGARPAVAKVLLERGVERDLPVYDSLEEAVADAGSRPPFLRERLRLVPTLDAITTARWFVAEVCKRWQADELTETAQLVVGELVTDAVLYDDRNDVELVELRVELRAIGFLIAVTSAGSPPAVTGGGQDDDPGSGLEVVQRVAKRSGVRRRADGARIVWSVLG